MPTPPELPAALTTAPKISGTLTQGLPVTAPQGSWSNQPFAFAHQWLRCEHSGQGCQPIPAPRRHLHPHRPDVGPHARAPETATNAAGLTAGLSKPSAVVAGAVPVASLPPTINGASSRARR